MLYNVQRRLRSFHFDFQIRGVIHTPPLKVIDAPLTIFSMVGTGDVLMYLLSIKSFYSKIRKGKITAIVDRDMPERLRSLICNHLMGVRLVDLESLDPGKCQRGGTWERLVHMVDHSQHEFAIQLDADTLSCGPDLREIEDCVADNRSFCYRDPWPFPEILTLREMASESRKTKSNYIGIVAERLFDRLPHCDERKYIRGSSGLAGFAKGGFERGELEEFHDKMARLLGDAWYEWGTEQCGSNYCIANSPGARVLPVEYRTYSPDTPQALLTAAKFLHFVGAVRFNHGYFAKRGLSVIRELIETP